jgi:hypothetical protein
MRVDSLTKPDVSEFIINQCLLIMEHAVMHLLATTTMKIDAPRVSIDQHPVLVMEPAMIFHIWLTFEPCKCSKCLPCLKRSIKLIIIRQEQ